MTVRFLNTIIPGTHGDILELPPEVPLVRSYFWGLNGVSELRPPHRGARKLALNMWIHNRFWFQHQLDRLLNDLDSLWVGNTHGTIHMIMEGRPSQQPTRRRDHTYAKAYHFCTLDRVERIPQPGQKVAVPLYDYVGKIGGWWIEVNLHFTQLRVGVGQGTVTTRVRRPPRPIFI